MFGTVTGPVEPVPWRLRVSLFDTSRADAMTADLRGARGYPSAMPSGSESGCVLVVEGASDQLALETLAERRGLDLRAAGVSIAAMGGATNIRSFVERLGPHGLRLRLAGLCDAGEVADFRRALEGGGLGAHLDREGMEALGFYACDVDLEDELIRALGVDAVLQVVEAHGELGSFRTLQKQVAQLGRPVESQLRRFLGSKSGRKLRYARLLVEALDLTKVPRPLDGVLSYASAAATGDGLVERLPTELHER